MAYPLTYARTVAAPPAVVLDGVLWGDLTKIFDRRFLVLAPVVEYELGPAWGEPGSSRSVVAEDGTTFLETLVEVRPGASLSYRMHRVSGPLRLLLHAADVSWSFEEHPRGCRVSWTWTVHPPNRLAAAMESLFRPQWSRYAGRAMSRLDLVLRSHRI